MAIGDKAHVLKACDGREVSEVVAVLFVAAVHGGTPDLSVLRRVADRFQPNWDDDFLVRVVKGFSIGFEYHRRRDAREPLSAVRRDLAQRHQQDEQTVTRCATYWRPYFVAMQYFHRAGGESHGTKISGLASCYGRSERTIERYIQTGRLWLREFDKAEEHGRRLLQALEETGDWIVSRCGISCLRGAKVSLRSRSTSPSRLPQK